MSNDLKIIFLGAPRTGTYSLWSALKNHENISCSKIKEPFSKNKNKKFLFGTDYYLKMFKIKEKTKFLLDGTPRPYCYNKEIIKKIKYPIKIIYVIRNSYDRIYSSIKMSIIDKESRNSFLLKNNKINEYEIMKIIRYFWKDSIILNDAYEVTNDVLIIKFDDIISGNLNPIFDFLNIKPIEINFPHFNSMEKHWEKMHEIKKQVDNFFIINKEEIDKIIKEDEEEIYKKYGIKYS